MRLGGGLPEDLDTHAWHLGNEQLSEARIPILPPGGTKAPNAIGLYDMFGSVAEWVTGTGQERVIVGASFRTPPGEFSVDWQMVEDQDVWNASYPLLPLEALIFTLALFFYYSYRKVCTGV